MPTGYPVQLPSHLPLRGAAGRGGAERGGGGALCAECQADRRRLAPRARGALALCLWAGAGGRSPARGGRLQGTRLYTNRRDHAPALQQRVASSTRSTGTVPFGVNTMRTASIGWPYTVRRSRIDREPIEYRALSRVSPRLHWLRLGSVRPDCCGAVSEMMIVIRIRQIASRRRLAPAAARRGAWWDYMRRGAGWAAWFTADNSWAHRSSSVTARRAAAARRRPTRRQHSVSLARPWCDATASRVNGR